MGLRDNRSPMHALRLYAGPKARQHIEQHGLRPQDVGVIPAAAGGPKGLILGPLDRFLFGDWLPQSTQPVHLVGASIGAWRMATACLNDPRAAFERLERDYIAQHYELPPGQKRPTASQVSERFADNLRLFYGGRVDETLRHPRYRNYFTPERNDIHGGFATHIVVPARGLCAVDEARLAANGDDPVVARRRPDGLGEPHHHLRLNERLDDREL